MNNYHTLTYRCGHGKGSEEDMIQSALKLGITELGFSEHVPLPNYRRFLMKSFVHSLKSLHGFCSFVRAMILNGPHMRMPYQMHIEHEKTVKELKHKYESQITIYQGYECEYFEPYLPYYRELLKSGEVDYLILGHHFDKYPISDYYYGKKHLSKKMIIDYHHDMIAAIHTGLFSYIAHPDLFLMGVEEFDELCQKVSYDICLEAKKYHLPLEINAGGMRRGFKKMSGEFVYPYTNQFFFQIASEIGNEIIIGFDVHQPQDFNEMIILKLREFARENQLNVIESIEMKEKEF